MLVVLMDMSWMWLTEDILAYDLSFMMNTFAILLLIIIIIIVFVIVFWVYFFKARYRPLHFMRRFWRSLLFSEDDARWRKLLSEWASCVIDSYSDLLDVFTSLNNKIISRRSVVPVNISACLRRCIKVACSTLGMWEIALPTAALAPSYVSLLQICNNITQTLELAVRKYFERRFLLLKRIVTCMFITLVVFWNNAKFQHAFSRLFLKFTNIFHATLLYSLQAQVNRTDQVLLASFFKDKL
jgi:hypothetical protein